MINTHTDRPTLALAPCHRMLKRYSVILTLTFFLAACAKSDNVPAFVEIEGASLVTSTGQGGATIKATDAWVTLDEQLIGVWELPARIPVLGEGARTLGMELAVKRNGAFDDRVRYPFYKPWQQTVDLRREGTVEVNPQTSYVDDANIWFEGFEDPFSLFANSASSDTQLIRFTPATHPELLFLENGPCAGFRLDSDHPYARVHTDVDFESFGGPCFLEIDHRGDLQVVVGVQYFADGLERTEPYIYLPATHRSDGTMPWSKVYVDLSGFFNSPVSERDLFIEALLPSGNASAQVYFDNIKLLRIQP